MYKIAEFFATVCYIGKIKVAPGTFGSLPAFPLCYAIMYLVVKSSILFEIDGLDLYQQKLMSIFLVEIAATVILAILASYFTAIYIRNRGESDPAEVVIDETVGQMLVIIFSSFSVLLIYSSALPQKIGRDYLDFLFLFIMPLVLFRIFDIMKPWPINWFDKNVKGAAGVMVDDMVAALFAIVTQYVIVFCLIELFPLAPGSADSALI